MKKTVVLKVEDLDCSSCVINIDGILEDTTGIDEAKTSFIKEKTSVTFDTSKIKVQEIINLINQTGYKASLIN